MARVDPGFDKRLGQHHLRSPALCRPLIEFLNPEGRRVVEIGPGAGALTFELLTGGASVWAWERDLRWVGRLASGVPKPALQIIAGDAGEIEWSRLPPGTLVTGNLPYNIATSLILGLLRADSGVPRAGFLVQLEVARRLVARSGDSDYGALSVLASLQSRVSFLGALSKKSFRPVPKVDGGMVGLELRRLALKPSEREGLIRTVRWSFGLRRKTLVNSLGAFIGRDTARLVVESLGWSPRLRAQEMPPEEFIRLYEELRLNPVLEGVSPEC